MVQILKKAIGYRVLMLFYDLFLAGIIVGVFGKDVYTYVIANNAVKLLLYAFYEKLYGYKH